MSLAFFQKVINYEFYAARQHSHMCVNIFIQLYAQNLCSWEKAKKVTLKCLGWLPNVSLLSNSQKELGLVCTQNNMISMNSKSLLKLLQEYMWIPKS